MSSLTDPYGGWQDGLTFEEIVEEEYRIYIDEEETEGEPR